MSDRITASSDRSSARVMHVLLTCVIAAAFVGLVVGLRQGKTAPVDEPSRSSTVALEGRAMPSTPWLEFDRRTMGPNSQWMNSLTNLAQPEPNFFAAFEWDESSRALELQRREDRRAFDGAPPVVPHPIDQMSTSACLACHGNGLSIAGVRAPQMSHVLLLNCTQCHVEQNAIEQGSSVTARNSFVSVAAPLTGARAWPGAPPTVPHSMFMRENCLACHGPASPQGIRSTHPWRTNCLQCHAPSAVREQFSAEFFPSPPNTADRVAP